jgi:probable rRNA maturation factor
MTKTGSFFPGACEKMHTEPKFLMEVFDRQRAVRFDLGRLERVVRAAWPACIATSIRLRGGLHLLGRVECSVVGARTMARLHRDFLDVRGATDVLTFPCGEIIVCAPVAAGCAAEFGNSVDDELALYCIHGLLHLAGHDDIAPDDAARMRVAQEKILKAAIAVVGSRRGAGSRRRR